MLEKAMRLRGWSDLLKQHSESDSESDSSSASDDSSSYAQKADVSQKAGELLVPKLPYKSQDLQGLLSKEALDAHIRIHKIYTDKTRELVKGTPLAEKELDDVVRIAAKKPESPLFINAAQAWNHAFYWLSISPPGQGTSPSGSLLTSVESAFDSVDNCRDEIIRTADKLVGSGWIWVVSRGDKVELLSTNDADTPLRDKDIRPLLCIDVWEHAYYLDYKYDRTSYLDSAVKQLLNWGFADRNWVDKTGW